MAGDRGGVFISYRREQAGAYAGWLNDRLRERFGKDLVFWDKDAVRIGLDYTLAIKDALANCDILLALIGPGWLTAKDERGKRRLDKGDDWVRIEIETALQRDIRVVTVLVDGALLPKAHELPRSLQSLAKRQALDISHFTFPVDIERIIEAIDEAFKTRAAEPAESPEPARKVPAGKRTEWKLEFLSFSGSRNVFRLSSVKDSHYITIHNHVFKPNVVEVDGHLAIKTLALTPKPHPLEGLSKALGTEVTIEWPNENGQLKWIIVKIGSQVLRYDQEP